MKPTVTIFVGPQGSGKTTEARAAANSCGETLELTAGEVEGRFGLSALDSSTRAVLIDGVTEEHHELLMKLKQWATQSRIRVDRRHKEPAYINTPNFFICASGLPDAIRADGRRFHVVEVAKA